MLSCATFGEFCNPGTSSSFFWFRVFTGFRTGCVSGIHMQALASLLSQLRASSTSDTSLDTQSNLPGCVWTQYSTFVHPHLFLCDV